MKKNAFTLAEVLITLGVISVISILTMQAVNIARPNETKIAYLRTYDALSAAIKDLVNDSSIYGTTYTKNSITYQIEKYPLLDYTTEYHTDGGGVVSGSEKLCHVLRDVFNGKTDDDTIVCNAASNTAYHFITPQDNIRWYILPPSNPLDTLDPDTTENLAYDIPVRVLIRGQRFDFAITADGNVYIADDVGQGFYETRHNLKTGNNTTISHINLSDIGANRIEVVDILPSQGGGTSSNVVNKMTEEEESATQAENLK
ncbi:MAG: prepilin-type N-terminal cleavage/methylation domain-containing protein [bacterium]|nr:prepilin-type N-terminal cleavage/methylation domain-containing protein [bacterium]